MIVTFFGPCMQVAYIPVIQVAPHHVVAHQRAGLAAGVVGLPAGAGHGGNIKRIGLTQLPFQKLLQVLQSTAERLCSVCVIVIS